MQTKQSTRYLVLTALFAAAVAATTAYILHIPLPTPTGGYVHVGDALIYLAATLLPLPWAMAAGAVGGAVADLLSGAAQWALPTFIIKMLICLPFTSRRSSILGVQNSVAVVVAGLLSPTLYGFVNVFFAQNWAAYAPQFIGTLIQGVGSGVVFFVLAMACDRAGLKQRLAALS